MNSGTYNYHGKSFGFGLSAIKRHPAITPIVVIIGGVIVGVTGFSSWAMANKLDVMVDKNNRFEKVNLDNPTPSKLLTIQQEYNPMPELSQLLKEINEADRKN